MGKILTVSVAAYNMGNYLRQTLSSLDEPEILKELEVFVIDDGGIDESADIAREYEKKYPESFYFVHKENEGYGSVVNWSVEHATGKYFKLLDGDDYFSREGLVKLVERMKVSEADAFISNTIQIDSLGKKKELYGYTRTIDGKNLYIRDAMNYTVPAMWGFAFRTDLLKKNFRPLPLHKIFTDQIYVIYGLTDIKIIEFLGEPVYFYRTGRDGQSISSGSVQKNYRDIIDSCNVINAFYYELKEKKTTEELQYLLKRAGIYYASSIFTHLRRLSFPESISVVRDYERFTKENYPDIYSAYPGKRLKIYRLTNYMLLNFI